ncbi:MAG: deoxyguanosinetriphosphate triphosphohydrolase [Betaproteobacteria bacterium]|nr:deoxyguanosinetriphosphate triphosphohydrolase [Betaproteobacteria bacterium]
MADLAVFAADPARSRGRRVPEPAPEGRTEYQRDRDRIVHSTAFRRLEYKTQVFVNHEGDLFRTRLTHSIEVAQIARSVARNLGLNEDLVEAISLAHDLGHTPFGHAGQEALNDCMRDHGGFEHNLQSLRVVDHLENRYGDFEGLNLTFETREGVLKHCSIRNAQQLGDVGERFLRREQPSLEAQLANIADELAYNNHDVDDGLRSGLLDLEALSEISLFRQHLDEVRARYPLIRDRRQVHETVRRMINVLVVDLTKTSRDRIAAAAPASIEAVRTAPPLVAFSEPMAEAQQELKRFLRVHLYQHYRVARMAAKSKRVVKELFDAFMADRRLLPPEFQQRAARMGARAVADYIAGMTDRYAIREHRRLFAIEDA